MESSTVKTQIVTVTDVAMPKKLDSQTTMQMAWLMEPVWMQTDK